MRAAVRECRVWRCVCVVLRARERARRRQRRRVRRREGVDGVDVTAAADVIARARCGEGEYYVLEGLWLVYVDLAMEVVGTRGVFVLIA